MYNDAGVTIYAWKRMSPNMSDEELEYIFNVAEALGCTHTTLELIEDAVQLKRIGEFAEKKKAGGDPVAFLTKFHDRIASFHLKDRTTPENGQKNVAWGSGDTPLKTILQMVKKNTWTMPATIEVEYDVPPDSDAVKEVGKCLDFCRACLVEAI